ncbi:integral inner nuclear membrane protein ima1-like [Bradysia coprophila]|uniref:integral inner nuclear membrane protein ima1-like n=1 Tax=Bradysia coprophila TaxID=38358 RepID=UPI00187DBBDC|nr:integral inner nuclear membrane protein ima1-like [Bradysia coprophila]
MSNLIERMSFIVPVVSISFIFIIISINLYMKIRKLFPITVNCWFCNKDANVPYSQFNSWNCEHCTQYNGFDKDGDYNCDIPAQRTIQLNKRYKTGNISKISYVASDAQRNRLCENCNRNQEIKVQQLALFEPIVKENFDVEIEKFREKLEKSYELCHTCQRSVKKTLSRIMNNVLGLRLTQIGQKGLNVVDRHVKKTDSKKHVILNRMCLMAISILSIWNIYSSSKSVHLSRNHVDSFFPPLVTHYILSIISLISAVKLIVIEYSSAIVFSTIDFQRMYSYIAADNNDYQIDFVINIAAVLLSLKLVLARSRIRKTGRMYPLLLMFLWNINMLWPTIAGNVGSEFVADLLKKRQNSTFNNRSEEVHLSAMSIQLQL